MRFGISSWSLPWAVAVSDAELRPLDPVGLMQRAVDLGVRVVQFADNLPLERADPGVLDEVQRLSVAHDVAVEIGTRGIGPGLLDSLALAQRFGAGFVRVVVDRQGDHPGPADVVRRLARYESVFRSAGLRLAIENHDRFRCDELAGVVAELGDWTGICLDTVNSLAALEPPDRVLEVLAPLAINLHVKDFVTRRSAHGLGFEVVGAPVGAGMLDVARVVEAVSRYGRTESAIIELWTPPQATPAETIAEESRWLDRSVAYLAGLPAFRSADS